MIGSRKEMPRFRSDFYRIGFKKLATGLLINAVIILLLVLGIIYSIHFEPKTAYYASTTEGLIVPMPMQA